MPAVTGISGGNRSGLLEGTVMTSIQDFMPGYGCASASAFNINRASIQYLVYLREMRRILLTKGVRAAVDYETRHFPHLAWWFIEEAPEAGIERCNFEEKLLRNKRSISLCLEQVDYLIKSTIYSLESQYSSLVPV